uniref:Piwi domain-containing protein n=1 Tax=Panagrellus redivivus TaxID=6233 RepID=A0A7E4VGX9_PANRE
MAMWHYFSHCLNSEANNVELYPITVAGTGTLADTYPSRATNPVALDGTDTVRGKTRNHVLHRTLAA